MEKRILGRDLEVSEIGFGCMGMSHAYGVERHIKYTKKIKLNARRHNVKFRSIQII